MCNACGNPAAPGHWTEAGAQSGGIRIRAMFQRIAILKRVLKPYGFSVYADGIIPQIQLICPGGARVMVNNLTELWSEIERRQGFAIDPLKPTSKPALAS